MLTDVFDNQLSRHIYSVAELNEEIQAALQASFPNAVWVRGEVQRLPLDAARRKHLYFELHDTSGSGAANYQIPVALLAWDRERFGLGKYLDGGDPDFQLRNELEVCLECRVDFYPPFGKLTLRIVGLDKSYSLGQLEAMRRQVLTYLKREGLLEKNAQLPFPLLPLQVGLITAAGSAAEKDFRTGLTSAPYPFTVDLIDCRMQGEQTERQIVQALQVLARRGVDVIVITRGGGSRGDLSWFDQKGIAVAIARAAVPVITAIGHEIDRSIADAVAHRSCKTPTAAAELLVARLDDAAERVREAEGFLLGLVTDSLAANRQRLRTAASRLELQVGRRVALTREELGRKRTRLAASASGRVASSRVAHAHRARLLSGLSRRRLKLANQCLARLTPRLAPARLLAGVLRRRHGLERRAASLGRLVPAILAGAVRRLDHLTDQARLLDPERLLARGYTLTMDLRGQVLKLAKLVEPGQRLRTRFQDGEVESIVDQKPGDGSKARTRAKGGTSGGKKAQPGQESLFR